MTACSPLLYFFDTCNCGMLPYVSIHMCAATLHLHPLVARFAQLSAIAPLQDFLGLLAWVSASDSLQVCFCNTFYCVLLPLHICNRLLHSLLNCQRLPPSAGLPGVPPQPAGNGRCSGLCAGPSRTAAAMVSVQAPICCCADSTPLCCCTSVWSGCA